MAKWLDSVQETERCLLCHDSFQESIDWSFVLGFKSHSKLCPHCKKQFKEISKIGCYICGRPTTNDSGTIECSDCTRWKNVHPWDKHSFKHRALFEYTPFLQEVIAQFKYRGDAELATLFSEKIKALVRSLGRFDVVTVIPLNEKRHWERGFNQAELLGQDLPIVEVLERTGDAKMKQSKLSREQRMAALQNAFHVKEKADLNDKRIVIIDDIYTTGATIRSAAACLYASGAKNVCAVTLARSVGKKQASLNLL
ncbi:ComF family protein [Evansella halocellulosilytica]|uniref:ComF family protein n=1 Tax=Evansella halocellulosilytica TaxID=2011013 RepID=UPI000BB779E8|nr:ComF family protein [Evansella halocellulosilytica]